jgi:hypothetical protein
VVTVYSHFEPRPRATVTYGPDSEGAHHAFLLHLWNLDFASFIVYCNWQGALSVRRCILAAIEDWKVFALRLHRRDGAVMMSFPTTTWVVLELDVPMIAASACALLTQLEL